MLFRSALEAVKSSDDKTAIDTQTQALMTAAQKIMEHAQAQTQANTQGQSDANQQKNAKDDDVVDAEFEEMK